MSNPQEYGTQPRGRVNATAAAALSQARLVGRDGNYASPVNPVAGATDEDYDSGNLVPLVDDGIVLVELAGTVAQYGAVTPDPAATPTGKAVAALSGSGVGIALVAGVSGDIVPVRLFPRGKTMQVLFERLATVDADATNKGPVLPAGAELIAAYIDSGDTLAADDTNNLKITLQVGATVKARRWTKATAGDGGLTADTPAAMVLVDRSVEGRLDTVIDETGTVSITDVKITKLIAI